jgi:hypothetical protein
LRRATTALGVAFSALVASACGAERWSFDRPPADAAAEAEPEIEGGDVGEEEPDALEVEDAGEAESSPDARPEAEAGLDCLSDMDCPFAAPVCDPSMRQCQPCASDRDCNGAPGGPACDQASGVCVPCTSNGDCQGRPGLTHCYSATHTCVACLSQSDCPRESFCAPSSHTCTSAI